MKKIFLLTIAVIVLIVFFIGTLFTGGILSSWTQPPFDSEFQIKAKYLKAFIKKVRNTKTHHGFEGAINEVKNFEWKIISNKEDVVFTGLHDLRIQYIDISDFTYNIWEYEKNGGVGGLAGGYIENLGQYILFSNGIGDLQILEKNNESVYSIDSNLDEIIEKQDYLAIDSEGANMSGNFGMRDLYWDEQTKYLYASYHSEYKEKYCYGLEIDRAKVTDWQAVVNKKNKINFELFFRTDFCRKNFDGHEVGGRILRFGNDLLVTVGSFGLEYHKDKYAILDSFDNSVGKIITLDQEGNFTPISKGHRNPQGLDIINGEIFISEHGPMGGDEINHIIKGKDYGWPYASYGLTYEPKDEYDMPHAPKYKEPLYYFSPSIAISEIKFYTHKMFTRWKENLLVTSLKDKSIYRLAYDKKNNHFISGERIYLGHRIRDIFIDFDGSLWMITDDQLLIKITRSAIDVPDKS